MKEASIIPGYVHVSGGNYQESMYAGFANPLTTCTGIVTDGDLEEGVLIIGFMLMSWGFAFGISWQGNLGE